MAVASCFEGLSIIYINIKNGSCSSWCVYMCKNENGVMKLSVYLRHLLTGLVLITRLTGADGTIQIFWIILQATSSRNAA